jgi:imidazolonepropionase-like amidohydrolase
MAKPDFEYIPEKIKEERWKVREHYWKNPPLKNSREKYLSVRKKMTKELHTAGVKLMAGSDSPEWFLVQGFAIHDELETFVNCGLSPYAALETATRNPAEYLGVINNKGTLETGKNADFVLLDKNPLEDIRNTRSICGVMKDGQWYDLQQINQLLAEAKTTLAR